MPHRLRDITWRTWTLVALLTALAWPSATAVAQPCEAPPGTSGIDQYCEQIPGPGGNRPPFTEGEPGRPGSAVPPRTRRELERRGADGQAILGLGRFGSAPRDGRSRPSDSEGARAESANAGEAAGEPSNNPFKAIGSAVDPGAESGAAFGWLLAGIFVACCAAAWMRYRRGASDSA